MLIRYKTGSILVILTAIAGIIGILSLSYLHLFSSDLHFEKKRQYHELAQKFLLIVHRDAYLSLKEGVCNHNSAEKHFLSQPEPGKEKPILVPFGREIIGTELPTDCTCEVSCKFEIKSFSGIDANQCAYVVSGAGHGILSIASSLSIFKETGSEKFLLATEKIETYHDFLVTSILDKGFSKPLFSQPLILSDFRRQSYEQFMDLIEISGCERQKNDYFQKEMPYRQVTLWSAKKLKKRQLRKMGIIDFENRQIFLNGIVHCSEKLELDDSWQIKGRGILIADEFKLSGPITRTSNDDLIIFFARNGNIRISTDQPIEAALIAMNRNGNGTIEAETRLQLHGAIIADIVLLPELKEEIHSISWNSSLNDLENSLSVSLGDWPIFRSTRTEPL